MFKRRIPKDLHYKPKVGNPRFGHKTSVSANQVIAAVHFTLGAPRWRRGAPKPFHSLVAAVFFAGINLMVTHQRRALARILIAIAGLKASLPDGRQHTQNRRMLSNVLRRL